MAVVQSEILTRLESIVDDAKARRGQSVQLTQSTAEARSKAALGTMRSTFLPRIIQITNDQDDAVTLSISNGRVAGITEAVMDGVQATQPDTSAEHVAQILNMVCSGSGIRICSTPPEDGEDIVATGLQMSEIDTAINALEPVSPPPAPSGPSAPEAVEPEASLPEPEVTTPAPETALRADRDIGDGITAQFYASAKKISDQRILVGHDDSTVAGPDGILTQNLEAVQQLMDDLSTWEADGDQKESGPQLIILRAQGQEMPSLTICRNEDATTMAAHHTRRLGSVVQLWKSLTSHENLS